MKSHHDLIWWSHENPKVISWKLKKVNMMPYVQFPWISRWFMYLARRENHVWTHLSCTWAAHKPCAAHRTGDIWNSFDEHKGGGRRPPPPHIPLTCSTCNWYCGLRLVCVQCSSNVRKCCHYNSHYTFKLYYVCQYILTCSTQNWCEQLNVLFAIEHECFVFPSENVSAEAYCHRFCFRTLWTTVFFFTIYNANTCLASFHYDLYVIWK